MDSEYTVDDEFYGEFYDELDTIRETVYDGLRLGSYVNCTDGWPICRLVILPCFENAIVWDVLRVTVRGQPDQARLYRSCWRMDVDLHALGSPVERPQVSRSVPPDRRGRLGAGGRRDDRSPDRSTPLHPDPDVGRPSPGGLDGTSYELSIGELFCHSRINWWERLPQEWIALKPVVEEMTQLFESSWNNAL